VCRSAPAVEQSQGFCLGFCHTSVTVLDGCSAPFIRYRTCSCLQHEGCIPLSSVSLPPSLPPSTSWPLEIPSAALLASGLIVACMHRSECTFAHNALPLPHSPPPPPPKQLAKTLGVVKLVVVINKLDDHSVVGPDGQWDQNR